MKKKLYLVTGFLGSGKTTLMKNLLNLQKGLKTGVIVNEFGKENVDGKLLDNQQLTMTEISNGSIFCSCRSDLFIDALISLGKEDLDSVFIETSGMSNPWSMPEVISIANSKTSDAYEYKGCITVVDGRLFMKMSNTINAINKQVAFADYILINKSDLISAVDKEKILSTVKALNQNAPVEFTTYCKPKDTQTLLSLQEILEKGSEAFTTAAQSGVRKILIEFPNSVSRELFEKFIIAIAPSTYRIKGFVIIDGKAHSIDCVSTEISIKKSAINTTSHYIVLIADSKKPFKMVVTNIYKQIFDQAPQIFD